MSYILDALRKADAERERGAVPGIHAQPLAAALPLAAASRIGGFGRLADARRRWLVGSAVAGLAAVLATGLWRFTAADAPTASTASSTDLRTAASEASERTARAAASERGTPPVSAPPAAAAPAADPSAAMPAAPPAVVADSPATTRAAVPSQRADPAATPARTAAAAVAPRRPALASATTTASPVAPSTASVATSSSSTPADATAQPAADNRVYQPRELPDDVRRELPALTIGGATYSENPASRMLIVNGQVFHENDKLATDLVLERIQLRSAVLRYKGLRFAIAY